MDIFVFLKNLLPDQHGGFVFVYQIRNFISSCFVGLFINFFYNFFAVPVCDNLLFTNSFGVESYQVSFNEGALYGLPIELNNGFEKPRNFTVEQIVKKFLLFLLLFGAYKRFDHIQSGQLPVSVFDGHQEQLKHSHPSDKSHVRYFCADPHNNKLQVDLSK